MGCDFLYEDLKILEKYLNTKGLMELCVNKPGEIWLETAKGWQVKTDRNLTLENLLDIARSLAAYSDQDFNEETPLLSTSLPPPYGNRIQVAGAPLVSGIAIAIRAGTVKHYPLTDYVSGKKAAVLESAVKNGRTVLVAGGTQSGKTTFLNSLIRHIPADKRLIIVEDTKEISADHVPNRKRLIISKTGTSTAKITYKDIINTCMRMRPDILLLGELDLYNTVPFLRLINTGHKGSMSTLHANSIRGAVEAVVLNSLMTELSNEAAVVKYVKSALDIIVFIRKKLDEKQRKICFEVEIEQI
jgi:type IV secretion system protein VirB11